MTDPRTPAARMPVSPAGDAYLSFPDVPGESTSEDFPGAVELLTWSFGVSTPVLSGLGGGAGTGRPVASQLTFTSRSSKASPLLFQRCCAGRQAASVTLDAVRAGDRRAYLTVRLQDVSVTEYDVATSGEDGRPLDLARLSYQRIDYTYRFQEPDGTPGETQASWDFRTSHV